jgi:hypothetical protein
MLDNDNRHSRCSTFTKQVITNRDSGNETRWRCREQYDLVRHDRCRLPLMGGYCKQWKAEPTSNQSWLIFICLNVYYGHEPYDLTSQQLTQAAAIKDQIDRLDDAIKAIRRCTRALLHHSRLVRHRERDGPRCAKRKRASRPRRRWSRNPR